MVQAHTVPAGRLKDPPLLSPDPPADQRSRRKEIQVLPPEEARKIAAGEVIDRPAALVRELLDNAIDAGSTLIEVFIEGGGSRRIEVIDDGAGMTREDLLLCCQTHATSKIRSLSDLDSAYTLGFRGEALAAAAAVAHLEILTSVDGREAWHLELGPGGNTAPQVQQVRRVKGTSIRALGIFDTIPVRKRFLKREWSEANLCKQAFIDKALAFPQISFRFTQDAKLKYILPKASSLKERFAALLLNRNEASFLHEINTSGTGFCITIVLGSPALSRNDRRQQYIFANGRRIQEYSLLQALEYGVQGWFPNNAHPVGAVYVDINPALADFNIHPAKREVRFADAGAIHHKITQTIRDFVHHLNLSREVARLEEEPAPLYALQNGNRSGPADRASMPAPWKIPREEEAGTGPSLFSGEADWSRPPAAASQRETASLALEALSDLFEFADESTDAPESRPESAFQEVAEKSPAYGLRYVGRAFGLFILVENEHKLFMIDQHAAHERILYEELLSKPIPTQELLVAIPFATESEEDDRFIARHQDDLARLGVVITGDNGAWRIEALPVAWCLGDAATVKAILNLKNAGEDIAEHWASTLVCHHALKEGDYLDERTALSLGEAALKLAVPRCPHGRPIWYEINRETVFRAVRRI
ncbi:MAG: DNA mismatch repair endonuclease MutL [Treponema sp.]|jgi:DNA mismatch repair protein MutL|nr:DNA mismatch repair endonuclease MutL [Treponema sp.]